jgi:hypothetical protein
MPEAKTYTGGCHCGQVRFECTTDMAMVTACNCSICTKKGLHFTFLPPKSFQLRAGQENLKEYLFNKHAIRHQLCIDCGVDVFARRHRAVEDRDDADRRTEQIALLCCSSCPGLTRASTSSFASQRRGWPGIGERKRRRPSDGHGPAMTEHRGRHDGATNPAPYSAGKFPPR